MGQEIKEIVITKRPMGILKYKKCTYGDYKDDPTAQTAEIDFDLFCMTIKEMYT